MRISHKSDLNFHSFINIERKFYKIIVDSWNDINVVSTNIMSQLSLTQINHLNPFKTSKVGSFSMFVYKKHLICLKINS